MTAFVNLVLPIISPPKGTCRSVFCGLCVIVARIFQMKVRPPETLHAPLVDPADLQTMKMPESAQIGGHVQLEHMFLLSVT